MVTDPNVLVHTDTKDDAAVYLLSEEMALVATTDFFTPVVDDPYAFGQIAAANALSDVYAMGARPIFALNLVGFPARKLPMTILGEILRGGADKVAEAGIAIVGGHSIDDPEPKYGLVVLGLVHPDELLRNKGARPGDALILTKPLGMGVITTAIKGGHTTPEEEAEIIALMAHLNRRAAEAIIAHGPAVHAMTDITGFGLLGHALEMLEASEVGAELDYAAVPILDSARRFAAAGRVPGGSKANLRAAEPRVDFGELPEPDRILLADAQTSGGLLAAVEPGAAEQIAAELRSQGEGAWIVGRVTGQQGIRVRTPSA